MAEQATANSTDQTLAPPVPIGLQRLRPSLFGKLAGVSPGAMKDFLAANNHVQKQNSNSSHRRGSHSDITPSVSKKLQNVRAIEIRSIPSDQPNQEHTLIPMTTSSDLQKVNSDKQNKSVLEKFFGMNDDTCWYLPTSFIDETQAENLKQDSLRSYSISRVTLRFRSHEIEKLYNRHRAHVVEARLQSILLIFGLATVLAWVATSMNNIWRMSVNLFFGVLFIVGGLTWGRIRKFAHGSELLFNFPNVLIFAVQIWMYLSIMIELRESNCHGDVVGWMIAIFLLPFCVQLTVYPKFSTICIILICNSLFMAALEHYVHIYEGMWCVKTNFGTSLFVIFLFPICYVGEKTVRMEYVNWKLSASSLENAKKEAENANKTKRNFLSYIFHEIRVPLNAICIGVDVLLQEEESSLKAFAPPSKKRHSISKKSGETESVTQILKTQVEIASHILDDVLSLQKIEEGKFALSMDQFNISEMLQTLVWTYSRISREKSVKLQLDISEDLLQNPKITGDQFRLRQVLANFISNAFKFTPIGGIIKVSAKIRNSSDLASSKVLEVSVTDSGVGISQADQEKLFHPYVQVSAGELQKGRGTGLGLNISKHIVRLHGGTIGVRSVENVGSKFFFQIPIVDKDVAKSGSIHSISQRVLPTQTSDEKELKADNFSRYKLKTTELESPVDSGNVVGNSIGSLKRFLIVDDDAKVRSFLKRFLIGKNKFVDQACNGQEAVDIFNAFRQTGRMEGLYDAILMDETMPGNSSFEMTLLMI
jgi:signal transduction histidine kinase